MNNLTDYIILNILSFIKEEKYIINKKFLNYKRQFNYYVYNKKRVRLTSLISKRYLNLEIISRCNICYGVYSFGKGHFICNICGHICNSRKRRKVKMD